MVNPNPVPPNSLVVLPSLCLNASKIFSNLSSGIPIPLSLTAIFKIPFSSKIVTLISPLPFSMNFNPFDIRLTTTCLIFCSSVIYLYVLAPSEFVKDIFLALFVACGIRSSRVLYTVLTISISLSSTSILPDSILLRSKILLIRSSRFIPFLFIFSS